MPFLFSIFMLKYVTGENMENTTALLITILTGLFFVVGFVIVHFIKKKKELAIFSTGMAFIVMLGMVIFDLFPEIVEMVQELNLALSYKIILIISLMAVGIGGLKLLDIFLPHHHHDHHEHEDVHEHKDHMYHIGFITGFSLLFHNILEGMSIFIISCENITTGLITAIAVGCHNIPLGIEIASGMESEKNPLLKKILLICLVFSSSLGALFLYLYGGPLPSIVSLILIGIACGMIIYIVLFELLSEIKNYHKEKYVYYGMLFGIIIISLMLFLE